MDYQKVIEQARTCGDPKFSEMAGDPYQYGYDL